MIDPRNIIIACLLMLWHLPVSSAGNDTLEDSANSLMLNELMQSNIDCVMDDLKDYPDSWVELYNGGSAAVNLNRYSLGITSNATEAWTLPDKVLSPNSRILVYCDKAGDGLHTNFRLESGKGCAVYLFCDGQIVDQLSGLKKQPAPNIGYGRSSDGSAEWGYELRPTPGGPNSGGICDHDHLLGDPIFSQAGSVFTDNPTFQLTLTVPDGSADGTAIHYTLDGTEPTKYSNLYTGPITISSTTVIRARLFCEGWMSPRSVTQSYIYFPRQLTLPVISIVTNDIYLNGDDCLYGVNVKAGTCEPVLNWLNSDFQANYINSIVQLDDGRFLVSNAIYSRNEYGGSEMWVLSPRPADAFGCMIPQPPPDYKQRRVFFGIAALLLKEQYFFLVFYFI